MFSLILALVAPSWASGIDVPSIGTGLSGPTTRDAAAVFWNPGMLPRLDRGQLLTGAGVVGGVVGYTRVRQGAYQYADLLEFTDPLPPEYIDPSRSGPTEKVTATPFAPTGDLFFASPRIADRVVLAGGVYVPYAAPLKLPQDGPQRFQLQQAFISVAHLTGCVGVELDDQWSVGAGLTAVSGLASIARVQDFAGVESFHDALANPPINQANPFGLAAPSTVRELDVLARPFTFTDGASLGIDFSVGVSFAASDDVLLGLSYQHGSRLRFEGDFALDMDDPFFTSDLAAQGMAYDPLIVGTAELSFRLPSRIAAGASLELSDAVGLDLQLSWIRYSMLKQFDLVLTSPQLAQPDVGLGDTFTSVLPRSWRDTIHFEPRIRAQLGEHVLGALTLGVQSAASPDSTIDAASPDGTRLLGAATGAFELSDRTSLVADLELQGIAPRTVTESDFDLGNGRYSMVIASALVHLQLDLGAAP